MSIIIIYRESSIGKVLLLRHCTKEEGIDLPQPVDSKLLIDDLQVYVTFTVVLTCNMLLIILCVGRTRHVFMAVQMNEGMIIIIIITLYNGIFT